ncbi:MAG TPA: hypothetical protein ENK54_10030 [Thiotrichales bacterium]|nr:hypothetical protein [Thiotrichales bacterium]
MNFGRLLVRVGAVITAAGMVGGFGVMFVDADSPWVNLIALVPLGFVVMITGTVAALLSNAPGGPDDKRPPEPD